jgi:glycine cleavage system transcriptional repressor
MDEGLRMGRRFIITLTAANRVGILAAVSNALAELSGDLREIRQTVVQKFFTMIIAADFPEHRDPQVVLDHIRDVCRPYAVDVTLKDPACERLQDDPDGDLVRYWLTMTGRNEPGVMRLVSGRLAQDQVDIWNLHAVDCHEGESFRFLMELAVPPATDVNRLQRDLSLIGESSLIDVQLQSIDGDAASDSAIYQRHNLFLPDLACD